MTGGYEFHTQWQLPAPAGDVFAVLADVENYPRWWPQVQDARRIDATSGELRCRSVLPYEVVFVMRREVEDAETGVLRASLTGDLVGTSQWTISADGEGARAVFDEHVAVGHGAVHLASRFVRPLLRLDHDHMMRAGEKGLRAHLVAFGGA
jgi:uncharacterized protein YndB with AHSA1/START domain